MDNKERFEAHKILHTKIYKCECKPYLKDEGYCGVCENEILEFMNKYGAGVLTNDILIEELQKKITKLTKENNSLSFKLELKIKRVEELKASQEGKNE